MQIFSRRLRIRSYPAHLIRDGRLPEGVYIEGTGVKGDARNKNLKLDTIQTVNQMPLDRYADVGFLHDLTSIHPNQRFHLTLGPDDIMGRALDLIVPIGRGQRGLIVSPPKVRENNHLKAHGRGPDRQSSGCCRIRTSGG